MRVFVRHLPVKEEQINISTNSICESKDCNYMVFLLHADLPSMLSFFLKIVSAKIRRLVQAQIKVNVQVKVQVRLQVQVQVQKNRKHR